MAENAELGSVLDDAPQEQEQPQEQPQEAPQEQAQPEPTPEPAPPQQPKEEPFTPRERAFLARAQDETRKRQAWEQKAREMDAQQPKEPPKDFWDSPEEALQKQRTEIQEMVMNARLNTAESISRAKHADFDEKVGVFNQVLQSTPGLHHQWLNAADPAEFAYNVGQRYIEVQRLGSIDAYTAKIEQDTRARIEAEYKAKLEQQAAQRAAIPGSLTEATSIGSNKAVWGGPTPIHSILGTEE